MPTTNVGIKPLDGYILILPFQETDTSGIELPPSLQKNRNIGTVIAICDTLPNYTATAAKSKLIKVKIGDKVYLRDYVDKPVEIDDTKYFFVEYTDILGVKE